MPSAALDAISYEDLYARWERGNWSATAIDFSEDRRQWEEVGYLSGLQAGRREARPAGSMFGHDA